jgi:hypothetical protein
MTKPELHALIRGLAPAIVEAIDARVARLEQRVQKLEQERERSIDELNEALR